MNKYHAIRVEIDGYKFASRAEARRYGQLILIEQAGEIRALEVHPKWDLWVNGCKIGRYTADFAYIKLPEQRYVVEDVKGGTATRTRDYVIRKKLMQAIHGIEVLEVQS